MSPEGDGVRKNTPERAERDSGRAPACDEAQPPVEAGDAAHGTTRYGKGVNRRRTRIAESRRPFTFVLDPGLVERARREVGDRDMVRSIEAALAAAIDYQSWMREISRGDGGTIF